MADLKKGGFTVDGVAIAAPSTYLQLQVPRAPKEIRSCPCITVRWARSEDTI